MRLILVATLAFGCGDVVKLDTTTTCGDSIVTSDEECDTGGESAGCNADCTRAVCGDNQVNAAAGEACDDGDAIDTNACNNTCTKPNPALSAFPSTGADGPFAPTVDTRLTAGIKNYTTITIPAGVTVTVEGYGALELRATGAVVINGKIDLSGGTGGEGATGVAAPCDTGGGGGGITGTGVAGVSGLGLNCPPVATGGTGTVGENGVARTSSLANCTALGGANSGGAGAGTCGGAAGGGGFAGGGGGAGHETSTGGRGAGAFGTPQAKGGTTNVVFDGTGRTPGRGGVGTNAYAGQDGTFMPGCATPYPGTSGGGASIGVYAEADLAAAGSFYPGSGGGGGGGQCSACNQGSGGGGGGGGALRVASAVSITVGATGQLLANGGSGGVGSTGVAGTSGGGGGSGGLIFVAAPSLTVEAGSVVSAVGGIGGMAFPVACGKGGDGGLGRIRISAGATCTLSGTFTPALANGCTPANMPEKAYVAAYPN